MNNNNFFSRKETHGWLIFNENAKYMYYPLKDLKLDKIRLAAPLRVYYDITYDCNLDCDYCYNKGKLNNSDKSYLTLKEKIGILNQMVKLGIFKLSIAGGEPFLDEDLHPFVEKANSLGISVSLTSNGTCISEEDIEFIKKGVFKRITISLDGIGKEANSSRVGQDYKRVENTIKRLVKDTPVDVALKAVIDLDTKLEQINDLLQFAENNDVKTVKISFLRELVDLDDNINEVNLRKEYFNLMLDIMNLKKKTSINLIGPSSVFDNNFGYLNHLLGWGCPAGKDLIYITPYGEIKPCVMLDDDFILGSLREDTIFAVWKCMENLFSMSKSCKSCEYINVCYGGCRARAIQFYNNKNACDIFCFKKVENKFIDNKELIKANQDNIFNNEEYCFTHL